MAKKLIRKLKKLLKLHGDHKNPINDQQANQCLNINFDELRSSLISIDSMLCNSASISELQYKDDAVHLLQVIKTHHIGLELLMDKFNIKIVRSKSGDDFDPEYMQALPNLITTEDVNLHGKVAFSVTPRFILIQPDAKEEKTLQHETVILYRKEEI